MASQDSPSKSPGDGEFEGFQGIRWEKEMKAKYIVVEESSKKNPSQMLDRR